MLIFSDITPDYSPEYPGGYGVDNVDADHIMKAEITLDFGVDGHYKLTKYYNRTMPPWKLNATDIYFVQSKDKSCSDCSKPCGCDHCSRKSGETFQIDCNGFMRTFPEGCITLRYEVFSIDNETGSYKSEGVKVKRIVNACHQQQKLIRLADKITGGNDCQYNFYMTKEKKFDIMSKIVLSWAKLQLTNFEQDCDCNCIDARIKRVRVDLDSIKL